MDEAEILERLQHQADNLMLEPLSPTEEALRNILAVVISILRKRVEAEVPAAT